MSILNFNSAITSLVSLATLQLYSLSGVIFPTGGEFPNRGRLSERERERERESRRYSYESSPSFVPSSPFLRSPSLPLIAFGKVKTIKVMDHGFLLQQILRHWPSINDVRTWRGEGGT